MHGRGGFYFLLLYLLISLRLALHGSTTDPKLLVALVAFVALWDPAPNGPEVQAASRNDAPSDILEVAVWSKPCGRYRGPLPRGKAVQAQTCDILAAFALSRRTIRYNGVEKHAVFGPKMVADDIVPRSLALREAGLKRRAGLVCP